MRTAPGARVLGVLAVLAAVLLGLAAPSLASAPEWNIARVGAPVSARGVLVAIVDTGVDASHPALAGRVAPAIDLVGGPPGDPNGHGTHVAGTAAGADAGCGSIGVAPDARILPVRVLDAEGSGTVDVVAEGIRRAADAGAAVINLSLGTDVVLRNLSGSGLREAIEYAWGKGSIPVLAAGNDGVVGGLFGSGYDGLPAVVVTATDNRDRVAPYATSIGGAEWGIAAPGGDGSEEAGRDILSAYPDRRCALSAGTSMAAPHVSGALAAVRAAGLDPRAAVDRILRTARDLGSAGPDATYGHGLLDVGAALAKGAPAPPTTTVPPATSNPGPASDGAPAPAPANPRPSVPDGDRGTTSRPSTPSDTADVPATVPVPSAEEDGEQGEGAGADRSPTTTSADRAGDEVDGSASAATPDDGDDGDDGTPAGLVVAAVAALGLVGAGSGVAVRRFGRPQ